MLSAPVGSGKTLLITALLATCPLLPEEREIVVSNIYCTDTHVIPRIPINIVVVPPSLYPQWVEHIRDARLNYIMISKKEALLKFEKKWEQIYRDGEVRNVLITESKYLELLNKMDFNYKYRVLRIVFDEADTVNFPVLWADFTWLVSATVYSLTKMLTNFFGSSARSYTMRGALKIELYAVENILETCINIDPKLIDKELRERGCGLEPFESSLVCYKAIEYFCQETTILDDYVANFNARSVRNSKRHCK